jgi:hypothetical protein
MFTGNHRIEVEFKTTDIYLAWNIEGGKYLR